MAWLKTPTTKTITNEQLNMKKKEVVSKGASCNQGGKLAHLPSFLPSFFPFFLLPLCNPDDRSKFLFDASIDLHFLPLLLLAVGRLVGRTTPTASANNGFQVQEKYPYFLPIF